MSVVTMYSEEYPEHAAACTKAFAGVSSSNGSKIASRTTPLALAVTSGDEVSNVAQFAANVFAAVETDAVPSIASSGPNPQACLDRGTPEPRSFTMEDGGQSRGACETAARAAFILANIFDEDEEPANKPVNGRTTGRYARQYAGCVPACAC